MTTERSAECTCCDRVLPLSRLHQLNGDDSYICRRCGLWVALSPRSTRH
jgi:predicted SprT family Zn-dependent metalloprotease